MNTRVQVVIVLGFHVVGCKVGTSFRDQNTNPEISNNLPNSLEYLYYVTIVQLLIVKGYFDASHQLSYFNIPPESFALL